MSRKSRMVMIVVSALAAASQAVAAPDNRTNLLLVMTDDQGSWSMGCYGNKEAHTPVLDKLAAGGVRMTRAFATIPVCSPSRATFYTGRIPSQHGIHDWIKNENMGPRARYCLPREKQISEILAEAGYICGLSGKWHLGDSLHARAGYTFWYAMPQGGSQYNDAEMIWQEKVVKTQGYVTDRITDKAVEFLNDNRGRPFFLNVEYNAPHSPYKGHPKELVDLFKDVPFASIPKLPPHPWAIGHMGVDNQREPLEQYFAACAGVDRAVGRLLAELDKLGLTGDTLVVYASDQGFCTGHHGFWGKGNGTNPRNAYDTSLQMPMIFSQPGRLPAGKTVDAMVSAYDFMPTVLDYLGVKPPADRNLPGRSFAPMLRGDKQADWPDAVFGEYGQLRFIRTADHKYVHRANGGPFELYDLAKDPDETTNLIDQSEHRELRNALRKRMLDWFERYGEAGADPVGQEYIRPAGQ
ncbi:MAG: sulfatase-like hydrolase/transferase [Planctomycetes bacterium]|nr:sulfatase-like hydrolase/transferase [Planctomycetota bacterium]